MAMDPSTACRNLIKRRTLVVHAVVGLLELHHHPWQRRQRGHGQQDPYLREGVRAGVGLAWRRRRCLGVLAGPPQAGWIAHWQPLHNDRGPVKQPGSQEARQGARGRGRGLRAGLQRAHRAVGRLTALKTRRRGTASMLSGLTRRLAGPFLNVLLPIQR